MSEKINIENLSVRTDMGEGGNMWRGFYIVDTTPGGRTYLNKEGSLQDGVLTGDCWWATRKEAMDFVLDMDSEKKTWDIELSQNGWEFTGKMRIIANDITRLPHNDESSFGHGICVDGIEIWYDETIGDISCDGEVIKESVTSK